MLKQDLGFKFIVKPTEEGAFSGYAAIFDSPDDGGEVIARGAFSRYLLEKNQFPLLWTHDPREPLGLAFVEEDRRGLAVLGKLGEFKRGREMRALVIQGAVSGLGIGFEAVKETRDPKTGLRTIKEARLWEVSLCVFPRRAETQVDEAKSDADRVEEMANDFKELMGTFTEGAVSRRLMRKALTLQEEIRELQRRLT